MEAPTLTHADALAEAARRFRKSFGEGLKEMYVLREDPYEPEPAIDYLFLVLLLDNFEPFNFSERIAKICDDAMNVFDYEIGVFARSAPVEGNELAHLARTEGVRL